MPQLTKSLKTRIEELTASLEAQTAELAAYHRVLHLELAKEGTPAEETPSDSRAQTNSVHAPSTTSVDLTAIEFTGNKTALASEIVKSYGSAGASSKEVNQVFTARKIKRGKNFVYKTLSHLAAQKRLQLRDGRYYGLGSATVSKSGSGAPAKKKMSAAAIKKIREGVKKYWATKKAAGK